jgi:hypothetical protein
MVCAKCKAANEDGKRFCGDCGAPLAATTAPAVAAATDDGTFFCARHKKAATRLRCGRCETPICDRCTVHAPTGVRCRDCARNRTPVRLRGVAYEVGRTVDDAARSGRGVWYLAAWAALLSFFSNLFDRGGGDGGDF